MTSLRQLMLRAGLVPEHTRRELARFCPLFDDEHERWPVRQTPWTEEDLHQLAAEVQAQLESEDQVTVRETDLGVLDQYAQTTAEGVLHVVTPGGQEADFPVTFGRSALGDILLPWKSETLTDLLANGASFLRHGTTTYVFDDVRELYFGRAKAFLVCRPAPGERALGASEAPGGAPARVLHGR